MVFQLCLFLLYRPCPHRAFLVSSFSYLTETRIFEPNSTFSKEKNVIGPFCLSQTQISLMGEGREQSYDLWPIYQGVREQTVF